MAAAQGSHRGQAARAGAHPAAAPRVPSRPALARPRAAGRREQPAPGAARGPAGAGRGGRRRSAGAARQRRRPSRRWAGRGGRRPVPGAGAGRAGRRRPGRAVCGRHVVPGRAAARGSLRAVDPGPARGVARPAPGRPGPAQRPAAGGRAARRGRGGAGPRAGPGPDARAGAAGVAASAGRAGAPVDRAAAVRAGPGRPAVGVRHRPRPGDPAALPGSAGGQREHRRGRAGRLARGQTAQPAARGHQLRRAGAGARPGAPAAAAHPAAHPDRPGRGGQDAAGPADRPRRSRDDAGRRVAGRPGPGRDRHLVADTVAVAMGLPPAAGRDPLRALTLQLSRRRLLLILDNCEHLLPECARVASALRARCPGVSVLATSREPLHVDGEVVLRVPSLTLPEPDATLDPEALAGLASVRLFLDRARDFGPDFALDRTNAAAVVEICRRLDGMPLAIELAAARTAHLEPAEIAERLGDALSVLGRPGTATRHATLRAALEWSHDLLAPAEQCLLRRLAVFEGGCTLAAAERVCAGGPVPREAVLDVLGRLVDKSLVQVDRRDGRSRYRLLDTVRQLAAERLARAGETGTLRDAHSRFFRELAAGQDPDRSIGTAGERPAGLDVEHDDLRAALAHGLTTAPNDALALAASLWRFWITRGHYIEGADWLGRALAAAPDDGQLRAEALRGLAVLEIRLGRVGRATELARESASLPAVLAAPEPQVVFARLLSGFFSWVTSDLDTAAAVAQESAVAATRLRRPELEAAAHWLAGLTALFREDAGRAEQELADCLDRLARVDPGLPPFLPGASVCMSPMAVGRSWAPVFEETALLGGRVGASQGIGYVQSALGSVHRLALRPAAALAPVQAAVRTFESLDDLAGLALALNHLGCVERDLGDPAAVAHLAEALRLRERIGDRRGATLTLATRGLAEAAAGDTDRGRESVRAALVRVEAIDDRPGEAGTLLDLAVVELLAGETHAARALTEDAIGLFRPQGYRRMDALVLAFAGQLAGQEADDQAARRHAEEAHRLFVEIGNGPGRERVAGILAAAAKAR